MLYFLVFAGRYFSVILPESHRSAFFYLISGEKLNSFSSRLLLLVAIWLGALIRLLWDSFLSSVVLQAQIDQCAKRVPELSDELYQAFEKWKEQNRLAIARGEAIVRTEWSKAPPPSYDDRLQRLTAMSARLFDSVAVPDKDIADKCASLLSQ